MIGSLGKESKVCGQLGQELDCQGAPMEVKLDTSHGYYHTDCFS